MKQRAGHNVLMKQRAGHNALMKQRAGHNVLMKQRAGHNVLMKQRAGHNVLMKQRVGHNVLIKQYKKQIHNITTDLYYECKQHALGMPTEHAYLPTYVNSGSYPYNVTHTSRGPTVHTLVEVLLYTH